MKYVMIVRLAGEIAALQDEMNKQAENGYEFKGMYESNARIIVVMEKAKVNKVGRPKKEVDGD